MTTVLLWSSYTPCPHGVNLQIAPGPPNFLLGDARTEHLEFEFFARYAMSNDR
jgi:hypothetical protein